MANTSFHQCQTKNSLILLENLSINIKYLIITHSIFNPKVNPRGLLGLFHIDYDITFRKVTGTMKYITISKNSISESFHFNTKSSNDLYLPNVIVLMHSSELKVEYINITGNAYNNSAFLGCKNCKFDLSNGVVSKNQLHQMVFGFFGKYSASILKSMTIISQTFLSVYINYHVISQISQ